MWNVLYSRTHHIPTWIVICEFQSDCLIRCVLFVLCTIDYTDLPPHRYEPLRAQKAFARTNLFEQTFFLLSAIHILIPNLIACRRLFMRESAAEPELNRWNEGPESFYICKKKNDFGFDSLRICLSLPISQEIANFRAWSHETSGKVSTNAISRVMFPHNDSVRCHGALHSGSSRDAIRIKIVWFTCQTTMRASETQSPR